MGIQRRWNGGGEVSNLHKKLFYLQNWDGNICPANFPKMSLYIRKYDYMYVYVHVSSFENRGDSASMLKCTSITSTNF
jgi:hypothetical protein